MEREWEAQRRKTENESKKKTKTDKQRKKEEFDRQCHMMAATGAGQKGWGQ